MFLGEGGLAGCFFFGRRRGDRCASFGGLQQTGQKGRLEGGDDIPLRSVTTIEPTYYTEDDVPYGRRKFCGLRETVACKCVTL